MYAIVEIAGQQFKVERGTKVYVHRLEASEGAKIEFDNGILPITIKRPLPKKVEIA